MTDKRSNIRAFILGAASAPARSRLANSRSGSVGYRAALRGRVARQTRHYEGKLDS